MADSQIAKVDEAKSQAVSVGNQPLDLNHLTLNQLNFIGKTMAESGMFQDARDPHKALVKILAGQEIGITPFQAMTNIAIIQGKPTLGANLYAAKVKSHPKYDYRSKLTSDECTITIFEKTEGGREEIGSFTYSMKDAERQGLASKDNWKKYPQNMLFARAISNATRLYAPDVFSGALIYTPDELGAEVNEEGEIIDVLAANKSEEAKPTVEPETGEIIEQPADQPAPPKELVAKARKLMKDQQLTGAQATEFIQLIISKDKPETEQDYQDLVDALETAEEVTE